MEVTGLEQGKKNRRRLNIYLDNEFAFSCFAEIASEYGIRKGSDLSPENAEAAMAADDAQAAREYAFGYAARGMKSEKQYRDKMREKRFRPESVDAAIDSLCRYGYIDDEEYARLYASELSSRYGPWAVRRKLKERGLSDEIIARTLEDMDAADTLRTLVRTAARKYGSLDARERRDKMTRFLASRGFGFEEVRDAIGAYESEERGDLL